MSVKTFKYRLYPSKVQERQFEQTLEACRWVYNKTLETRKTAWETRKESLSLYDTNHMLTDWKREHEFLKVAYSQSLQDAQERIDLAFKAFFRRVKAGDKPGYPRFRGKERYDSWTYPQFGFRLNTGIRRLNLSKIGMVKIVLHRPLEGKIKTLTIHRTAAGDWYACFSCEVEPKPMAPSPKVVGLDMGLESFVTLSTGEKVANPRFFRKDEKALAKAQQRMDKEAKGTPEWAKRCKVVAKIHKRIANRRADFAHKLSRRLVGEYGILTFEDLNIGNMLRNHCLAKSITDAAWNQLIQYAMYKAEYASHRVVLVDPRNTSKTCSRCGVLVEKDLSVRVHSCPHCGLVIDRDLNAAINILRRGLSSVGTQSLEAHPL